MIRAKTLFLGCRSAAANGYQVAGSDSHEGDESTALKSERMELSSLSYSRATRISL